MYLWISAWVCIQAYSYVLLIMDTLWGPPTISWTPDLGAWGSGRLELWFKRLRAFRRARLKDDKLLLKYDGSQSRIFMNSYPAVALTSQWLWLGPQFELFGHVRGKSAKWMFTYDMLRRFVLAEVLKVTYVLWCIFEKRTHLLIQVVRRLCFVFGVSYN